MRRRGRSWLDDLLCDVQDQIRDRFMYERECAYCPDDEDAWPPERELGYECWMWTADSWGGRFRA